MKIQRGGPVLSKFQAGDGFVCFQCFELLTGCLLACLLCLFTVYSSSSTLNACSRNDAFKPECISERFRPIGRYLYRMCSVFEIEKVLKYRSETETRQIRSEEVQSLKIIYFRKYSLLFQNGVLANRVYFFRECSSTFRWTLTIPIFKICLTKKIQVHQFSVK